jgi:hypothetical protein
MRPRSETRPWRLIGAAVVAAAAAGLASADDLTSGPQVGQTVPGLFDALTLNGPTAGEECCLYCRYGNGPVAMTFAPKPSADLAKLVRVLEAAAAKAEGEIGACVVVTDTSPATRKALGRLADDAKLKHVVLAVVRPDAVQDYAVSPDAALTVVLYSRKVVRVNRAFKPGELDEKALAAVSADVTKHFDSR